MQALSFSQDVTESSLKAAFIYNFVLFTDWPAGLVPPAAPLVLCVLGDDAVEEALRRTTRDRVHGGHGMTVTRGAPAGSPRGCQVLYVSGMTTTQAEQLVAGLRDLPVLTISDIEGFTQSGGIAQFFLEQGRLRFAVQNVSAQRAHLQISSRLLALARPR